LVSGPFADFIGEVEELFSGDRVKLLFKFMQQYKSLEVPTFALERMY
jgi:transcription antitermination factor NusG